jgi:predicted NAD/FAD-binding protein
VVRDALRSLEQMQERGQLQGGKLLKIGGQQSIGENHTYHAGAYLGDDLHGGAITAAVRVAKLIGMSQESISSVESKRERISFA